MSSGVQETGVPSEGSSAHGATRISVLISPSKRALSPVDTDVDEPDTKRSRTESSTREKKHRKRRRRKVPVVVRNEAEQAHSATSTSPAKVKLTRELSTGRDAMATGVAPRMVHITLLYFLL
jgi:hypothetical protein